MATSIAPELPSPLPCGASEWVLSGPGPEQPQARALQRELAVSGQRRQVGVLQRLLQLLRLEEISPLARPDLRVGAEPQRGGHHHAALASGVGRHVGPPAREVESHRCGRAERGHGATDHRCTLGSSPRKSISTSFTLRLAPCSPAA